MKRKAPLIYRPTSPASPDLDAEGKDQAKPGETTPKLLQLTKTGTKDAPRLPCLIYQHDLDRSASLIQIKSTGAVARGLTIRKLAKGTVNRAPADGKSGAATAP